MTDARSAIQRMLADLAPAVDLRNQLAPFLAQQEAMRKALLPATLGLQEALRVHVESLQESWKGFAVELPQWLDSIRETQTTLKSVAVPFIEEMRHQTDSLRPLFESLAKRDAECARIEAAGWLPHYTTPSETLQDEELNTEGLDQAIGDYYERHWLEVKVAFLSRLPNYEVDDESKRVFADAIEMHEAGFYRATARVLFPEIERVARKELHANAMTSIASQRALRTQARNLSPAQTEPCGMYGIRLFYKLMDHLYANTKTSADLMTVASDPVPNRHAALHGFLAYDTAKNSINMLIMADFIFQVISAIKRDAIALEAGDIESAQS